MYSGTSRSKILKKRTVIVVSRFSEIQKVSGTIEENEWGFYSPFESTIANGFTGLKEA